MFCVYMHTVPNGKVYVGITSLPVERRWKKGEGYKQNKHFYSAIQKYGWESIKHEVLFDGLTKDEACEIEKELILKTKSHDRNHGYNFTFGGEAYEFTDDVKEKMKKNHTRWWLGKHHTDEQKAKISEAMRGKKLSEEHKARIKAGVKANHSHSNHRKGKHHSEESKRKISEHHFRAYGAKNPSARKVRCVETGEIFDTMKEAGKQKNANPNHISSCCSGKKKTTGGYHWEYATKAS